MKRETVHFANIVDDVIYYIGTSAKDNFAVIDMGRHDDYWFHCSNCSSCHVVVQVPDKIDKRCLKTILKHGALLCKQHTNKLSNCDKVEIIYCQVKNVVKTDVSGLVEFTDGKMMVV
jgi:hypothetical protein